MFIHYQNSSSGTRQRRFRVSLGPFRHDRVVVLVVVLAEFQLRRARRHRPPPRHRQHLSGSRLLLRHRLHRLRSRRQEGQVEHGELTV